MKGFAFAKTGLNSWGVAASVTKGTYFESDGGLKYAPSFNEDKSFGQSWLGPAESGDNNPANLTLTGMARYEDHNYVLRALCMGSPNAVTIVTSTGTAPTSWQHIIDLAPSIDGLAATFAFERNLFTEEITSAKVFGFGESPGDGGIIKESFKVLGTAPTNQSSININSTVYGASFPTLLGRVARKQGTFRINAQGGGALGGSDAIAVTGAIDFTFERPQDISNAYGSAEIIEPADNDFPPLSIKVSFHRANTVTVNSFRAALQTGTAYKADLTYLGAFINSTDRYTRKYQFPYLELQDATTATQGAAQVKPELTFMLKLASALPTGMSTTNPFRFTQIMTNSVVAF